MDIFDKYYKLPAVVGFGQVNKETGNPSKFLLI